jgi:hypothetical protein
MDRPDQRNDFHPANSCPPLDIVTAINDKDAIVETGIRRNTKGLP